MDLKFKDLLTWTSFLVQAGDALIDLVDFCVRKLRPEERVGIHLCCVRSPLLLTLYSTCIYTVMLYKLHWFIQDIIIQYWNPLCINCYIEMGRTGLIFLYIIYTQNVMQPCRSKKTFGTICTLVVLAHCLRFVGIGTYMDIQINSELPKETASTTHQWGSHAGRWQ